MIEFKNDLILIKDNRKKIVFISVGVFLIVLLITFIAMQFLKYQVEGETNLPFKFTNLLIVSTADAIGKENSSDRWDLQLLQNNDIYLKIDMDDEKDSLQKITIQNFVINNNPIKGEPKIYHPVDDKDLFYLYKEENLVDDKIEYNVSKNNNVKKLQIAMDGGIVSFSSCSDNIANFVSNDDTEIKYDGTLLNKVNISADDLKYQLNADIIIEMKSGKKYKTTMCFDLPLNNILEEGTVKQETSDFDNLIFKRI